MGPGAGPSIFSHTITNVKENMAIVAGGIIFDYRISSKVYESTLSSNGRNVVWKALPSMFEARRNHVAFNLYDSLYLVGGFDGNGTVSKSCEIFNLGTQIWTKGKALPCELRNLFATTDAKKTFAIICGWTLISGDNDMKIIILNKDDGFKMFSNIRCTHTGSACITTIPDNMSMK